MVKEKSKTISSVCLHVMATACRERALLPLSLIADYNILQVYDDLHVSELELLKHFLFFHG